MSSSKAKRLKALALLVFTALLLSLSLSSCGKEETTEDPNDAAKAILDMSPIFQSVALYNELFDDSVYSPADSTYFWRLMWIMTNTVGANDENIVFDLAGITVPENTIKTYARALSHEFDGSLPPLPEGTSIAYDAANATYIIPWSEAWPRSIYVDKVELDGSDYIVRASLLDMSSEMLVDGGDGNTPSVLSMSFRMAKDEDAGEGGFAFRIKDAEI